MSENDSTQAKVELGITQRFLGAFSKKVEDIQRRYADHPKDFKLEAQERDILMKINNGGLLEGALAGIASFVALRRLRTILIRRAFRNHSSPTGQNPNSAQTPMQQMIQQRQEQARQQQFVKNPFQRNNNTFSSSLEESSTSSNNDIPKSPFLLSALAWVLDFGCAFAIGSAVSLYRFDLDSILSDLSKIPLSPGESAVSREFCPEAISVLAELQIEGKTDKQIQRTLQNPQNTNVAALIEFTKNCERRERYEAQLRREKGVSSSFRVSIPEPGVPLEPSSEDDSSFSGEWIDGGDEDNSSFSTEN